MILIITKKQQIFEKKNLILNSWTLLVIRIKFYKELVELSSII